MDIQLNCVLNEGTARSGNGIISEGNISNDDFSSWFPLNSVVNATTLKIHEHRRDRYLTLLKEDFEVDYGRMPDCVPKDSKCVSFFLDNYLENYNFILYENKTMRLHVSKRGSFHGYDEGIWEFERVKSDEEINMTLPWSSKGNDIFFARKKCQG